MSLPQVHTTLVAGGLHTPKWCHNNRIIGQVKLMFAINCESIHEKAGREVAGEREVPRTATREKTATKPWDTWRGTLGRGVASNYSTFRWKMWIQDSWNRNKSSRVYFWALQWKMHEQWCLFEHQIISSYFWLHAYHSLGMSKTSYRLQNTGNTFLWGFADEVMGRTVTSTQYLSGGQTLSPLHKLKSDNSPFASRHKHFLLLTPQNTTCHPP